MSITHLEAIELALRKAQRPLTSKELVSYIEEMGLLKFEGKTPNKTLTARLSMDIRNNGELSVFVRTGHSRFSLRGMNWEPELVAKPRLINPLEEMIKVVKKEDLLSKLETKTGSRLYQVNRTELIQSADAVLRSEAETRFDIVQLIPCFVVMKQGKILTYQRTKRLPEERLHNTKSINFGGHLQSDDFPDLFADVQSVVDLFMMRELYEELEFSTPPDVEYLGGLYLQNSNFERQHFGVVFCVNILNLDCVVSSKEPGNHTNLKFESINSIALKMNDIDSWSQILINEVGQAYVR